MPCPHNEITIVQRSQRQSAVAAAAYQSGEKLFCEYDQQVKHYPEKRGIVHNEILLPANAPPEYADRNTLTQQLPRPMSHGLAMMTKTASGSMNGGITAATVPLWNRTLRRGYRNTSAFTTSASSRPRLPAFTSITPPSALWTLGHSPSRPATPRMRLSTTISASRLKMDRFWRGGI